MMGHVVLQTGIITAQRGQALPLALMLMAVAGIAWIALYNVGQTASARVRLTHVADAVAYSGALAQARSLNLLSYINRAQVAHQVAMAHLVTLGSWAQFGQTQSQQHTRHNPQVALIGKLFGSDLGAAYARASATSGALPELADAFQQHDHVVHQILQQASASVVSSLVAFRRQAMWQVLRANYPEFDRAGFDAHDTVDQGETSSHGPFRLSMFSDGYSGYLRQHQDREDGHLRGMAQGAAGRYDFLRPRDLTRRNAWTVQAECPTRRHELRRRGETWLDTQGRWAAEDTLSYHALRSNRWIGCHYREYAMGWGQNGHRTPGDAKATPTPPHEFSQQDFWRWVHENTSWDLFSGRSNSLANAYGSVDVQRWPSRGLPAYHEIDKSAVNHALRFAIQVRQSATSMSTTDAASNVAAPVGRYTYLGLRAGQAITVGSAAETYFARPHSRVDGRHELASLFRPYWQARLSSAQPRHPEGGPR
ncbi:hypothetical protein [Bordetella tumulicola]|uniref:hypothetical protein n=1 Tax=Bordetella tumulicola TaxID=1649133 RepID=UPI0039EF9E2A